MAEEAYPTPASPMPNFTGSCFCKSCTIEIKGDPQSVSICHCINCRQLSGAPFTAQIVVSADQVSIKHTQGMVGFNSSPQVTRYRCATCSSPIYATLFKGKSMAIPVALIAPKEYAGSLDQALQPTLHMYYSQRVMDVNDSLPKYTGSVRSGKMWSDATNAEISFGMG
eukprot:CAMPEP_0114224466 /NCGR_PEP_ID=MMETSP0058-20121206/122_1 /TAXON_ID=36894 /ORGANISM="Pyramimonas parkeae, CCMP726" /LENGTH=167 /DNA_ID=CAMNT_0001334943 /DNA_START=370 /DNA_END=873 /DNA_ORIENTATION=+